MRSIAGGAAQNVDRKSAFSYACNACGLCCHEKVITLSPYDVLRIARGGSHDRRGERQSGEPRVRLRSMRTRLGALACFFVFRRRSVIGVGFRRDERHSAWSRHSGHDRCNETRRQVGLTDE